MLNRLKEKLYGIFHGVQSTVVVQPGDSVSQRINDTRLSGPRRKTLENPTTAAEKLKKPGLINAKITSTRLQALKVIELTERNVNERFVLADHLDQVADGQAPKRAGVNLQAKSH